MARSPYDILVDAGGREVADEALRNLTAEGWRLVLEGACRHPEAGRNCGCQSITVLEQYHPHDI